MYYSGTEILEIAVRIEENGHAFYTEAAKRITDNTDIQRLFEGLAKKEIKHIAVFKNMADNFQEESPSSFEQSEIEAYTSYCADTHIFQKKGIGAELGLKVTSSRNALEIAYKFEVESVHFYQELNKHAQKHAQKIINLIIEEEREHANEIKQFLE